MVRETERMAGTGPLRKPLGSRPGMLQGLLCEEGAQEAVLWEADSSPIVPLDGWSVSVRVWA